MSVDNDAFNVLASSDVNSTVGVMEKELLKKACFEKQSFFSDNVFIGYYSSCQGKTILLYLETDSPLSELEKKLLELFSQNISIAYNNLCLHEEIIDTQSEVVKRLGSVIESRSQETAKHVERVSDVSYILAKAYGLSEEEATRIRLASPMHDIGKVAISDQILKKPGKLTEEEFEKMKEHSLIGWKILKDSNRDLLKTAALIARDHHEKWDGTGYPNQRKAHEISIYGRITAVADVFDAVSHKRVYKDAWPLEKVLEFFHEQRGLHFDPKLVDLFFENLDKITDIHNNKIIAESGGNEYIKNLKISFEELGEEYLKKLLFKDAQVKLVIGFVSPYIDLTK